MMSSYFNIYIIFYIETKNQNIFGILYPMETYAKIIFISFT